ncbi:hypothetical protein MKEN_00435600 [Mycena kentingensis (nom. inval.)]|nr:hypothetical protein MKEN_00435600 [Mycena kentingensis (nom. inval.)]
MLGHDTQSLIPVKMSNSPYSATPTLESELGPIAIKLASSETQTSRAPSRPYPATDQSYWSPITPSSAYSQSSAPWSTPPASRPSSPSSTIRGAWSLSVADFRIPRPPCALEMRLDENGVYILPDLAPSSTSTSAPLVTSLLRYRTDVLRRCEPCAQRNIECSFVEYGLPCRDCGPNCRDACDWLDGDVMLHAVGRSRQLELDSFRRDLVLDTGDEDELGKFRRFGAYVSELDSALLAAVERFKLNLAATQHSFESMEMQARAEVDIGRLGRFIELAHGSMSPRILRAAAERVLEIMDARLRVSPIPLSST